jgi:hypothetical protein
MVMVDADHGDILGSSGLSAKLDEPHVIFIATGVKK